MADKLRFQEKLRGILDIANEQDMRLEKEDIEKYFEEDVLSEQQMELVYDYLLAQKVIVKGYVKKGGTIVVADEKEQNLSEEEQVYLKEYQQNLQGIHPEQGGERTLLFRQAAAGDGVAKSRLIELYLSRVAELAREMKHPDVFIGDMIQEGNISLMLALDNLTDADIAEEVIEAELREGIQAVIEAQADLIRRDNSIVKKVRELDEKITELTDNLGREATIEELVMYTEIPEEEIRSIIKLTEER
ncbi:MAG: sigma-70 domain-containing protein [Lachnospiraceae bacterium]